MKGIKERLLEAVARKSGNYERLERLEPDKKSIVNWLDINGFKRYDYVSRIENPHLNGNDKYAYLVRTPATYEYESDWISIHTPKFEEIVIWFAQDGSIDEIAIRRRKYDIKYEYIDFDTFSSIIKKDIEP